MEQSFSWEANSHSATQILCLLYPQNPKVHYSVHKRQPLVPLLIQMHPDHAFPLYLLKIHFDIFFHLLLGLPFMFSDRISIVRVTCPIHLVVLEFITLIIFDDVYKLF
jgi:hypothetical protein